MENVTSTTETSPTESTETTAAVVAEKKPKHPQHPTFLTSVKILVDKYDTFRATGAADKLTLQKLVNRTVFLYNSDPDFRKKINETTDLQATGSSF
jgi:hypothetical protein